MQRKITARFESVDMATNAASDIRRRFKNVLEASVSYERPKRHSEFLISPAFTPTDIQSPILQNGIMPMALATPFISGSVYGGSPYSGDYPHGAKLELQVTDRDTSQICGALRQDGGRNVKLS